MSLKGMILGALFGITGAGLGQAQGVTRVVHVAVYPSGVPANVPRASLPELCGFPGTVGAYTQPKHGTLTEAGGVLTYAPGPDFWMLGLDSIDFTVSQSGPSVQYCGLLFRLDRTHDTTDDGGWELDEGRFVAYGIEDPTSGGSTGGGGGIKIRVPPRGGPIQANGAGESTTWTVYQADGSHTQVSLDVTRDEAGLYSVSATLSGIGEPGTTTAAKLVPGQRQVEVDWWRDLVTNRGGVRLRVDGRSEKPVDGFVDPWYSGFVAGVANGSGNEFECLEPLRNQGAFAPAVEARIRSDFEGSLLPWQGTQTADIMVAPSFDAVRAKELVLRWPASQPQTASWWASIPGSDVLNARLRLKSRVGSTGTVALLSAFEQGPNGLEVLRLSAQHVSGSPKLLVSLAGTPSYVVSLGPGPANDLTLQWRSPSAQGAGDGLLRVWDGGTLVLDVNSLSIGGGIGTTQKLGSLRLGQHVASSGSGTLRLDDVEVWY